MATPTRLKKRLGAFLREVRKRTGRSVEDAAAHLKAKHPTVSRYETGEVMPAWPMVHMLLTLYGASESEFAHAAVLYEEAKEEPRSVRLTAGASKAFRKLVAAEREAVRERELAPFVLPGLLQTRRYVEALLQAGHTLHDPQMRLDAVIGTRLERQKQFEGTSPMELHALIDEAVLHREIGGPEVMVEQLEHLLADRPNITLQVIPFAVGGYGTMNGSFSIVDYPEPDAVPGVYLEYPAGGDWIDDANDVARFTTTFDQVAAKALSPAESTELIRRRLTRP